MLFVLGITALISGMALVIDPSGKVIQFPEGYLKNAPFSNYLIPGLLLSICIGMLALTAWFALWKKPEVAFLQKLNPFTGIHWAWAAALKSAIVLIIWIVVQMQMVAYFFLQPLLLAWGILILLCCFAPGVRAFYEMESK